MSSTTHPQRRRGEHRDNSRNKHENSTMSVSVEANMLLRIRGDPCVKTFVQTRSFQNAVAQQAGQRGVYAACLDLEHIRLIPHVENEATHFREWEEDARAAGVRPRAVVPVKAGPALELALEADAEAIVAAPAVNPSADQFNKMGEDMAALRAEATTLAADKQLHLQLLESQQQLIDFLQKTIESQKKTIESGDKAKNEMQAEIAVHCKHINTLLPWVTQAKLVSKRRMLESYRKKLFAEARKSEDDSVVDLIRHIYASNSDEVALWVMDKYSSISADIHKAPNIKEAQAVVRDNEDANYGEVYFRLYGHRYPEEESS